MLARLVHPIGLFASMLTIAAAAQAPATDKPGAHRVPDEATAVATAVPALVLRYGEKAIAQYQPYHASLQNGVWHISGSLPAGSTRGGTPQAHVGQANGEILRLTHGR